MYPKLHTCLVRGAPGDFFLQKYLNGLEFKLSDAQALLLHTCNGSISLQDIAKNNDLETETLQTFFDKLKQSDLLTYSTESSLDLFPALSGAPYLQEVQIEGTGNCNLWCKHCYGRQVFKDATNNQMTYEEFVHLADQLRDANVARVFLSGGEIFTLPELPKMIHALADRKIHVSGIFTNGTIHRNDVFNALTECGLTTSILVSMDGHTQETHDYIRGSGNFQKTVRFIQIAREKKCKVTVNTVATRQNIQHLLPMRQFLEDLGVSRWRISVQREQGEAIKNREVIEPDWSDVFSGYLAVLNFVLNHRERAPLIQLSSVFKTEFLTTGKYYLYRDSNSTCEYKRNSLVVSPQGNIMPCPAGYNMSFGNIRTDNILKVWQHKTAQSFKTIPIAATECSNCDVRKFCGAGCRVIAQQKHGSFLAKDTNACILYHFFRDKVKPLLEKVGVEGVLLEDSPEYMFAKENLDTVIFT